jgi:hypothetical protein
MRRELRRISLFLQWQKLPILSFGKVVDPTAERRLSTMAAA